MHRFLKYVTVDKARLALRSDASIWLIAQGESDFSVNRGEGWVRAAKIRLCSNDGIRIGGSEVSVSELCSELGIDYGQVCDSTERTAHAIGERSLVPLSVPDSIIDDARRNPETGQIEPNTKEKS
jgi:hypothetical protein